MSEFPTPQAFLSTQVARVNERAAAFAGITWTMAYDFTADGNGKWYFKIVDGTAQPVQEGESEDPTVTVSGKFETFFAAMTGKLSVAVAFMTGKLKSVGDNKAGQRFAKMMA
jgi:putative sterol carrier protein